MRVTGRFGDLAKRAHLRRPRWRALAPALALAPIGAAAIGAATHPPPISRYRAEVSVIPGGASSAQRHATAALMAGLVHLPTVLDAAVSPTFRKGTKVTATVRPSGILTLELSSESQPIALAAASALAERITSLGESAIDRANQLPAIVVGNFGLGLGSWAEASQFVLKAQQISIESSGRVGHASLEVKCKAGPGCGATTSLTYPFRLGVRYTATALVRDSPGASAFPEVHLLFGSNPRDVVTGKGVFAGHRWQRLSVSWSPNSQSTSTVEIGAQSYEKSATFLLSKVIMTDPTGLTHSPVSSAITPVQQALAVKGAATATIVPARSIAQIAGSALKWGLIGLAVGMLMAIAAIAAVVIAGRRSGREHQS